MKIGLGVLRLLRVILSQVIWRVLAARLPALVLSIFYGRIAEAVPQGRGIVNIGQWEFSFDLVLEGGTSFLGLFNTLSCEFSVVLQSN